MISLSDQLMLRLNPQNIESMKHKKREAVRTNHIQNARRNHYAYDYSTPKHWLNFIRHHREDKNPEANFIFENRVDLTHLKCGRFL